VTGQELTPPAVHRHYGPVSARPNIVFVFSDQHRARTTGYEGAAVATPAMDRLAAEGVVFDTAVSSIPVCTPWRAALFTGQYPLTNGVFLNDVRLATDRPTLGNWPASTRPGCVTTPSSSTRPTTATCWGRRG